MKVVGNACALSGTEEILRNSTVGGFNPFRIDLTNISDRRSAERLLFITSYRRGLSGLGIMDNKTTGAA